MPVRHCGMLTSGRLDRGDLRLQPETSGSSLIQPLEQVDHLDGGQRGVGPLVAPLQPARLAPARPSRW